MIREVRDDAAALLPRVADTLLGLPYRAWNFGDSVAFEAMVAASDAVGDQRWLRFAQGFVRAWASEGRAYRRLDATAPGLAMVRVHERTGDPMVLEAAVALARYLVARPRIDGVFATWDRSPLQHPYGPSGLSGREVSLLVDPPAGVFVDCLHFDPPFLVALGGAIGDASLVDEGVAQARGYVRLLQADSGLFDHFALDGAPGTYGPSWGRGQGWALLGLLDVLDGLDAVEGRAGIEAGHDREELAGAARRLVSAMLALQRDDGHWSAVVDDAGSGDETSTAAFMVAGLARAARLGVAEPGEARAAALRALRAVLAATNAHGVLAGVSAAVNACTSASHYAYVPTGFVVPWGQGPMALALAEALADDRAGAR